MFFLRVTRDDAAASFPHLDAIIAAIVEGLSATVGDDPCPAGDRARAADRARGFVLSGDAQDVAVALIAPLRPRVGNGIGALARRRGGDYRPRCRLHRRTLLLARGVFVRRQVDRAWSGDRMCHLLTSSLVVVSI